VAVKYPVAERLEDIVVLPQPPCEIPLHAFALVTIHQEIHGRGLIQEQIRH
jgi:hypothetical protein